MPAQSDAPSSRYHSEISNDYDPYTATEQDFILNPSAAVGEPTRTKFQDAAKRVADSMGKAFSAAGRVVEVATKAIVGAVGAIALTGAAVAGVGMAAVIVLGGACLALVLLPVGAGIGAFIGALASLRASGQRSDIEKGAQFGFAIGFWTAAVPVISLIAPLIPGLLGAGCLRLALGEKTFWGNVEKISAFLKGIAASFNSSTDSDADNEDYYEKPPSK